MKCPRCRSDNPDTSRFCANCAEPLRPSGPIQGAPTKTITITASAILKGALVAGKYRVIDEIGRGGMGVVYRAEDTRLKRTVALKFLSPELTADPEARQRFIQEAQAAAALSHPNICVIYEVGDSDERSFIAMEYVEGETLRRKIMKGPLIPEVALDMAAQIAEGLCEAHKKGIIHRDIKSANIIVTERGQAKIMDFGLAKLQGGRSLTETRTTLGTVAYMSPEQARGEKVDHRTDIWSLGVVLYEMLTGGLPFKGDREASILYSVVHEEPKPLKEMKPGLPQEIEQIVSLALKKKPESRYSSALEMLEDLKKYQQHLQAERAGALNLHAILRRLRRPRIAIPAAIIVLAMSIAAIWFFSRQAKIRWAKDIALPEIERLLDANVFDNIDAYQLAQEAEKFIPGDPRLVELFSRCSKKISVETAPPGASIYAQEYRSPGSD
jgi:serine/threonine protein kinase